LIANREVVPEVVQDSVTTEDLVRRVAPLLEPDSPQTLAQRAGFREVRERLGGPGASDRVALLASELIQP
jgi:lipid-A-disaccharide synthase